MANIRLLDQKKTQILISWMKYLLQGYQLEELEKVLQKVVPRRKRLVLMECYRRCCAIED